MSSELYSRILCESHFLRISYVFEEASLTDKRTGKSSFLGSFHGDPTCGLIGANQTWCVVGGSTLLCWKEDNVQEIKEEALGWAFQFRQTGVYTVHILIDPWAENAAIWELNIQTLEKRKIRDFTHYKNREYTEHVDW